MNKDFELKKLSEVCNFQNGFAFKSNTFKDSGTPVIRITNIKNEIIDTSNVVYINPLDYDKDLSKYEIKNNDLLIAMSGATTGKIGIYKGNEKLLLNQRVGNFKPKDKLSKEYLFYFLLTKVEENLAISAGSAQPNLSTLQINNFMLPLFNLDIQKQIVEILDKAFESIEQAKANIEKNIENTKELFQSRLNEIFSQKGEGWEEKTINDVCKQIFAGGDKPEENFSKEKTDKYNIPIFANAIKDKGLYGFTDIAKVTEPSITISARGSGTGHTELRNVSFFPIVRLIVLIPNSEILNLEFFKYIIDNLEILRSGSAIPQLTIPMIKEYSVRFPSILKQKQIVEELYKLNEQTKQLEKHYNQKLKNIEELKKSILQKAFSGELLK